MPRLAEHDLCARCNSCLGMTCQIFLADIRFGLGDPANKFLPVKNSDESRTDQLTCNCQGRAIVKISGKNHGFIGLLELYAGVTRHLFAQVRTLPYLNLGSRFNVNLNPSASPMEER